MRSAALFKLKQNADPKGIQEWGRLAQAMVGKVPGKSLWGKAVVLPVPMLSRPNKHQA